MSGDVITIEPKVTVKEASQKMCTYGIGTLVVVVEGDYPVGIISERDITYRVVARDLHPSILMWRMS
ncbi:CBS domain protein [archaeon]|nr:CBS domain protein [archaeon]